MKCDSHCLRANVKKSSEILRRGRIKLQTNSNRVITCDNNSHPIKLSLTELDPMNKTNRFHRNEFI